MVIVVMGVTGSGKTTVGKLLAEELGWSFYDADDFHPDENKLKMNKAIPLTDEDRLPWLAALRRLIDEAYERGESFILACSALKESYRDILSDSRLPVKFVYLRGPQELIKDRLEARRGHYMNPALLNSQFATLEEPSKDEALYVDIRPEPSEIAASIKEALKL